MAPESRNQTRFTPSAVVFAMPALAMSALVLFAESGCSTATRYYTLSSVESAAGGEHRVGSPAALIGIGPVELPDYVDIPNIVVRTGSNTLDQATFDQWGGSLDDMVPRVLVEDLALRLPTEHFVSFPQSGDLNFDFRVPVTFSQFDVTAKGEAVLIARWQIRGKAGSGMVQVHETTARAQADGTSYQQRVAALSKALGIVTDEIAKALAPLPRAGQATGSTKKPTKK